MLFTRETVKTFQNILFEIIHYILKIIIIIIKLILIILLIIFIILIILIIINNYIYKKVKHWVVWNKKKRIKI